MARVAGYVHRNTPGQALRIALQTVAPLGGHLGIFQGHCQHMPHMVLVHKLLLLVRKLPVGRAALLQGLPAIGAWEGPARHSGHHLVGRVEHQPGYLLHRQPAGQVAGPLLHRQPPIFIGQKLSCSGQILEIQPVLFYNLGPRCSDIRPIWVFVHGVELFGLFLHV